MILKQLVILLHEIYSLSFYGRLAERVRSEKNVSEFFIDASHELSLFAWNKGKGHQLTEAPYFCLDRKTSKPLARPNDKGNGCAIYSRSHDDSITQFYLYSPDTTIGTTKPSFVSFPKIRIHIIMLMSIAHANIADHKHM